MAVSKGLGTYGDGAGVVTPTDHKLAHLGLISKTGAGTNTIRSGLFYDGVSNIVTGAANMSYNVAAFTAVSSRGPGQGAVLFANDGTVNVATTAAPGSNSRIDVVYVWQREFALDGGSTAPVIGVVQGTPASSPAVPSLSAFPGAIELARITVPAGVTATNSGATITQTAPFTAAAGGVVTFRTIAERDAAAMPNGTVAFVLNTGDISRRVSGAWRRSDTTITGTINIAGASLTSTGNVGTTAYWGAATIMFGQTFAQPPAVTVDVETTGAVAFTQVLSVTTTGLTFRVTRIGAVPGNLDYRWSAVGVLA